MSLFPGRRCKPRLFQIDGSAALHQPTVALRIATATVGAAAELHLTLLQHDSATDVPQHFKVEDTSVKVRPYETTNLILLGRSRQLRSSHRPHQIDP
ncbi:hypothetical protein F5144DRAFT_621101 [Chaetomium tenue]|uniref:Uncharacterized protein n=1 Tax=Chaetomium tenue TaxID=1854479 RepID=A0ACB7PA07_9PEZI|nr:hypothetical protein F5144DRAFT_621101 [Chaetomium globosum]